ncbi:UNVERIFIED_CONTAM: hypothetical protein Slati_0870800 [Sesamum latifolium]|uniref:Integrase catalytic domain-containing protein n=1 Tax=Sesamum latifolium TaxID=2727402 RepID=A0AAW2XNN3_9LAMI
MTRKPFVRQSMLANGLLDLIHTDVCGPLNTQARGGFSYFITFIDDHSWYGYVYLMRYKSEAFVRFKEFRLEVENQTDCKIKTLWSDQGGEHLSSEFLDYLEKNGIVSQWTPPGMLQLNGVAKRRNRTLLDMAVGQAPYQIWHGKLASYKYLRVWGSPAYVKRLVGDKLDSRTSSAPILSIDNVPVLRRLARVPQPPERYGFLSVIGQLDNDPKTYRETMPDIDSEKWLEVMKFKMDSMSSNQVWTLVGRPKCVKPVRCRWVYKCKIDVDGEVTTFKARLVAKGYTLRPGINSEDTFSPVAMAKSMRIMLAIAAWYDYAIWQMDVKMASLNGSLRKRSIWISRRDSR